jgi:glycosyltransferase involved in cell wall biosynthesis
MILVSRNDPESHAMLRQVLGCGRESLSIKRAFFNRIYIADCSGDEHLILCDDPFALLYARLFHYKKTNHIRLWALEIWEHQVPLKSLKSWIRFLVFSLAARISYLICDSILIPSETRRSYLSGKYSSFNLRYKSKIILNIPVFNSGDSLMEDSIRKRFMKFRSAHQTVLIYAGSLQEGRLLDGLVNAENTAGNIGLVLCGSGPMEPTIKAAEKINASILFLGNLDESGLSYAYQHSDVGILAYDNKLLNTRMCAPLKLWEYLFFNLLIIGNDNEALRDEWAQYIDGYFDCITDIYPLINDLRRSDVVRSVPKFEYLSVIKI